MIYVLAALLLGSGVTCPPADVWESDRATHLPRVERKAVWARIKRKLKSIGAHRDAIRVARAVSWRESRWDNCASHDDGTGSGAFGMKHRFYGPRETLLTPELAAVKFLRAMENSKRRYRAKSWLRFGQIYGGRILPYQQDMEKDAKFCSLLHRVKVDCADPIKVWR